MTAPFQLRSPAPEEAAQLAELGRETFVETFGHLYRPVDLQTFLARNYAEGQIHAELTDPELEHQVIEEGGKLIAFIKLGPLHLPVEAPARDAMEIRQLYVRREFTARGLGRQLMDWAFAQFEANRVSTIYLSVFSENERAIRFYRGYGFEKCGQYEYPVGDHVDLEYIMTRSTESRPSSKNT